MLHDGAATLATRPLGRLRRYGKALVVMRSARDASPPTACLPGRGTGDVALRLARHALRDDPAARAALGRRLVLAKLDA